MHNLHFQGLADEALLIDAPTQDVGLFCLLCLPVASSWIMSLTSLVFMRPVTEVLWSAQSCLIDFCNPVNSCVSMS